MSQLRFVHCFSSCPESAPALGGDVTAMYVDDGGDAWIAAADGRLNRVDAGERTARTLCETASPAFSFTADAEYVYCATADEVVRTGRRDGTLTRLPGGGAPLSVGAPSLWDRQPSLAPPRRPAFMHAAKKRPFAGSLFAFY